MAKYNIVKDGCWYYAIDEDGKNVVGLPSLTLSGLKRCLSKLDRKKDRFIWTYETKVDQINYAEIFKID